ncbi:MAG: sensor histidine kinase [Lachnospiraceae bacterium]|nr:sensor histidine kinase [Lachnospiraceae bacterium]MBQ8948110.1 sensor histidine kinase [Lachnospiraceae bacterium]
MKSPKSLRSRILILVTCYSMLIAFIVGVASFYVAHRYLIESERQSSYINLQLIGNSIDSDIGDAVSLCNRLLLDSRVEQYLTEIERRKDDVRDYRRFSMNVWTHLNDEYRMSSSYDLTTRFFISTPDGSDFLQIVRIPATDPSFTAGNIMEMPYFDELLDAPGYRFPGFTPSPVYSASPTPVMPVVRPVRSSKSPQIIGWIYVEISSEIISSRIDTLDLPADSNLYMTFENEITYLYKDGRFIETELPPDLTHYELSDRSISLSIVPSELEMRKRSTSFALAIIGILFFILLTGIAIYVLLRGMINKPVDAILAKLSKVGGGDFGRDESIEWDNEFGRIGKGINDLSNDVNALINNRLEDERARQNLEYRILQSQINPHFMYNTLNTIKWMATIRGADGIADMSTALSRLLKNISKSEDNLIPLRKELELLNDYYTIMKYRYGGTIELVTEIEDEDLTDCLVNRFSLQPIVENAIFHGIEPKGSAGRITIRIFSREGQPENDDPARDTADDAASTDVESPRGDAILCIDVHDNGIGMDQKTIEDIMNGRSDSSNDFFKDVGIANVNSRIKFTFGDEYGLTIESVPSEYTCVHFVLPCRSPMHDRTETNDERNVQNPDS